jgi:hypothetical protein
MEQDADGHMQTALSRLKLTGDLSEDLLERTYRRLHRMFNRESIEFQLDQELGGAGIVDGWREVLLPDGRTADVRAFPPRLIHVMAGNTPSVAAQTILRSALTKGVHLLKLPSNDLFTATAVLKIMSAVAPNHPTVRSFASIYWRGGDTSVESVLFRPQFFDKVVAWGGEASIRNALQYIGPGFELVAFDPKNSISLVGHEAFDTPEALADAADGGAADATIFDQDACVASRFQFVEGTVDEVDRYCEALVSRLNIERETSSTCGAKVAPDIREEIEGLRALDPIYRVWGSFDGTGMVIRSDEPVTFQPGGKVVNVVPVESLADAVRFATVATQTVGVYPNERRAVLRDALCSAGVQRVTLLGGAQGSPAGLPHDGFYPLHRFMRWVKDD